MCLTFGKHYHCKSRFFLNFLNLGITANLQKSCKHSTKIACPSSMLYNITTLLNHGTFVKAKKINNLRTFSSVQSLGRVRLFATPWTAACQASLSITNYQSLPKLMSIESVIPSSHHILCHPLLLLPSIFPNIRVFFSNEPALQMWRATWWVAKVLEFQLQHQSFPWTPRTDLL